MTVNDDQIRACIKENAEICEIIRNQVINIPKGYNGTINPKYLDAARHDGMIEISGNSFGPFNPDYYFSLPSENRLLFILREPYIPYTAFNDGDRGKHNQGSEYYKAISSNGWDGICNRTIENIAKISYTIMTRQTFDKSSTVKKIACEKLLNNVAIMNINNYPLVCSSDNGKNKLLSNKKLISEWGDINKETLIHIITLYNAALIYCGGVAYSIYRHERDLFGNFGPYNTTVLRHSEIQACVGYPLFGARDFFYNNEHLIINGYHPECYRKKDTIGIIPIIDYWKHHTNG